VALTPGTRLGPYVVSEQIGAGGMGEVYLATDMHLSRQVAIKVLPDTVASDPDRLARFDREARTLAALNHPNIAVIYGVERANGITALVLELVEGPTLADRLAEGPIPIDDALVIARQIVEALEAAHEQGIVHRDLKPANVKLRSDGRVKVLDFGLAKAIEPDAALSPGLSRSPTITTPAMTQAGVILGTAAYMSPEQARGKSVDRRADIWAFGCVLYEMLAGRRTFQNEEVSDTLAFVLTREPDWSTLPKDTPPAVHRLLRRCLLKDRAARLPDIGAARLDIDEARTELTSPSPSAPVISRSHSRAPGLVAAVAVIVAIAALALWMRARPQPVDRQVTRLLMGVEPADRLLTGVREDVSMGQGRPSRTAMTFSPDGRSIVFSGERDGRVRLYVRRLDQLEATAIEGTEGASSPFFSPRGDEIGFYADGALRKLPLAGGPAVKLCEVALVFGASWGTDDRIVFATVRGSLQEVPASGGKPMPVTKLQAGEISHRLPQLLPDGESVLFTATKATFPSWDDTSVVAQSLKSGQRKILIEGGADARYVSSGHLLYLKQGTLMAVPFDVRRVEVTGAPVGVLADVMQAANIQPIQIDSGAGQFTVSDSGSLAYVNGGVYSQGRWSLVWIDRAGQVEPLNLPPGAYLAPRVSPDGKRLAYATSTGDWDIWTYEIARGIANRLAMEGDQGVPVWTPDGNRLVFTSGFSIGGGDLYVRNADGSGKPEKVASVTGYANTWTPDGLMILSSRGKFWLWSLADKRQVHELSISSAQAGQAELSPDGHWLVYNSVESTTTGRNSQMYAQPYPALDRRTQIATNSHTAKWRNDGRELYYEENASEDRLTVRMMAVSITTTPSLMIGTPHMLFEGAFRMDGGFRGYDATPDGQRFLMVRAVEQPPVRISQMVLVQNWFEELKTRVPVK
jgi:eukaryotic-like serine/threonine-protein kinase